MTVEKLDHLEERIRKPGYLLLLVVVLLFLIIGFVDLIDYSSPDAVVFGRYSLSYFVALLGYTAVMLAWASLLLRPNDDRWLTTTLDFIQNHPLLAVAILIGIALVFAAMIVPGQRIHGRFLEYPALQTTIFVVLSLAGGLILFYKWGDDSRPQMWRKIVVGVLGVLLVTELAFQALAFFGLLPNLNTPQDSFAPYARVYQSEEGLGNGMTNSYGRYAPPFELLPDARRIALVGDSFVQGLQVSKDDNMGTLLQHKLDEQGAQPSEVLTLGYPDYGPGMYLNNWMLTVNRREFAPDDVITFFDLGSDFQVVEGPGYDVPFYEYVGQGRVQLNLEYFFTDIHNYEHAVMYGHEGFQPVRVLGSHYLTPRVLSKVLGEPSTVLADEATSRPSADIDLPNGFVFKADTNDEAMLIAKGHLQMAQEQLGFSDTGMSLVTIPAFTDAFFAQDSWNTAFGESDLLLPEIELRRWAELNQMPFLGLGAVMAASGMSPQEVQALYFEDGRGHFTPAGHAFAADAVHQCFFAQTLTPEQGCDRR